MYHAVMRCSHGTESGLLQISKLTPPPRFSYMRNGPLMTAVAGGCRYLARIHARPWMEHRVVRAGRLHRLAPWGPLSLTGDTQVHRGIDA